MDVAARTQELAREVVEEKGIELIHVEFQHKGAPPILRLYIDKPGGVTLDDCVEVSRHVGVLLEGEGYIDRKYVLEVSSPGIERPLFKPEDYRRFQGKEIRLNAVEKIEGRRNFVGVLKGFSQGMVELDCEGRPYQIPFEKIKKARLVYKF